MASNKNPRTSKKSSGVRRLRKEAARLLNEENRARNEELRLQKEQQDREIALEMSRPNRVDLEGICARGTENFRAKNEVLDLIGLKG
jgi:hypothetical protein